MQLNTAHLLARGNARMAAMLYAERFPNRYLPGHCMFVHKLASTVGRRDGWAAGCFGRIRARNKEGILQHFRGDLQTNIRAATNRLRIASHSDVWQVLHDS